MSLQDYLILSHLKRTHVNQSYLNESYAPEEIIAGKLYKLNNDTRIEFTPVIENVWSFSLLTTEGSKECGRIYKVSENEYVARSNTAPDIEKSGKTLVDAAIELLSVLGEI